MSRPSKREARRRDLAGAFERVLARHGLGGATIAAVAREAGVAPGLVHHHFHDREDLVAEVVRQLARRFRARLPDSDLPGEGWLLAYTDAALAVDDARGEQEARAWVGLFAEAIRGGAVTALVRRALLAEHERLEQAFQRAGLSPQRAERSAAALLSAILGALLFGALVPGRSRGFAAPSVRALVRALLA